MDPGEIVEAEQQIKDRLAALEVSKMRRALRKLVGAALSSIPWVGGFLVAFQAFREEESQVQTDLLQRQWIEEHQLKVQRLAIDLGEIVSRLDKVGEAIQERLESEEYLALVRRAFRSWDQADTEQKREYVKRLISNAGATMLCPDDLVRLFLNWLDQYHEAHFMVIREIYKNPGATRLTIWQNIHGNVARDNSSEADLFKFLITELSIGRVIRQERQVNHHGQFIKKQRAKPVPSGVLRSAFDDEEGYELTELGSKFVHYVFSDVVVRLGEEQTGESSHPVH